MQEKKVHPDGPREYRSEDGNDYASYEELLEKRQADGVTGEISPNVQNNMLLRQFVKNFQHAHEGITREDCYIVITKAYLGIDKDGDPDEDILIAVHGCPDDLVAALSFALSRDPVILNLFTHAVEVAKRHRLKKELGGLLDGLAAVFGHGSAKDWSDSVNKNRKPEDAKPETNTDKPATDANK